MQPTSHPEWPFIDWPVVLDPAAWQADVALLGITHSEPYPDDEQPNDQTRAPDAVRRQSAMFSYGNGRHWDFDLGSDLASILPGRCVDCGNAVRGEEDYDSYSARVRGYAATLFGAGAQLVVLGGDHGVTIPVLDALEVLGTPVHIVHIDAHLDWREEVGGVRRGYSSPLRRASEKPWIAGMTQIGLRSAGSARRGEVLAAQAYGSRLFTAAQVHDKGIDPVVSAIPERVPLYLTIDADGLDPTVMPAVMAPAPGGLYFEQVAPLLVRLARRQHIVGMDIVEIAPRFDAANAISCITAGRLIVTTIGASWAGRRARPAA
ncbi:MAG TPA: arginase family protein [Steroidobacteraceae bacterium]|nr:arginase family protein [Steroidobacteraceae bacterium]